MKARKWVLYPWIIALAAAFLACPAKADLFWETRSVSTNIGSQPNGNSIQKYYFSPYAARVELGAGNVIIIHYKTMKLYSLNTRARTCTEINLARLPEIPGVNRKQMAQMLGAVMGSEVVPTNHYRTIAGYRCREYYVRIAIINGEYWISRNVKGYRELKAIGAEAGAIAQSNPLFKRIDIPGLVRKLGGFPVRTVNHVMGGYVTSTLTKIEQKPLDPSLFDIPRNYTMKKIG